MTFTWQKGRQLASVTKSGETYTYTYDSSGVRKSKTVDGVTTNFTYVDGKLIHQTDGTNIWWFYYDSDGTMLAMKYNDNMYFYQYDGLGNIVGLVDVNGAVVAEYVYDAWGRTTSRSGSMSQINPFTFKNYYYDTESGLYYLMSRYYDPVVGRFINADGVSAGVSDTANGYNLYAYCFNNPVNMVDDSGNWPKWIKSTVKWVAKNIVKPVVKTVQKTLSKVDLTYSTGVNLSGTPGAWIFNGQIGVSMDTKGNVAVQASGGGGITGGNPGISITRYQSVTNAPNIDKLNDAYYQVGGSIAEDVEGVPVAVGGDVMFMPDPVLNTGYFGLTGNLGFGTLGKESHVEWGTTVTLPYTQFNIYDVARTVYINIMEW